MRPFHHRRATLPLWALLHETVAVGLIPDGHHVEAAALRLAHRLAGDRIVLVSDPSAAAGAPQGRYSLQGVEIELRDGVVRNAQGALAGSAITLDEGVRRWMRLAGATPAEAVNAASSRPARLVGLPGAFEAGNPADLVVLDGEGNVRRVMKNGAWVRG